MILKISLRAKAGVPKTLVKQKLRLHSLYFPQNTLMLTESRGEFSHLRSIFRPRALRYYMFILLRVTADRSLKLTIRGMPQENLNNILLPQVKVPLPYFEDP